MNTFRFVLYSYAKLAVSVSSSAYNLVQYYVHTHRWETLVCMLQNAMAKCEETANSVAIAKLDKSQAKRDKDFLYTC